MNNYDDKLMELQFTRILQERLADSNLSKLSDELSINRSLLQDWVHNNRKPSLSNMKNILKLADYLGLSLEELLIGTQSESKTISSISFNDDGREYRINIQRIR